MQGTGYAIASAARLSGLSVARVRALIDAGVVATRPDDDGCICIGFDGLALLRQLARLPASVSARRIGAAARRIGPGRTASGVVWEADGRRVQVRDEQGTWEPESGQQVLAFESPRVGAPIHVVPAAAVADTWYRRGHALESRDPAAACDAYRRALEADPDHADANINLGRLVHESGQADAAADLYRAALRVRPDDAVAWFNLGVALGDTGDLEAALVSYARVLEADPGCADAHFNAARLCERRGDRLGSLRHLRAYRALMGG